MTEVPRFPCEHQPGDRAYFQPVIGRIDGRTMTTDDTAIPVKVVAVRFGGGKILYDIALPDGEGGFYEVMPICNVDSYLMVPPAEVGRDPW